MKCSDDNCGYWWADEGEEHPSCHYPYDDGYAPCEIEDNYESEDIDE